VLAVLGVVPFKLASDSVGGSRLGEGAPSSTRASRWARLRDLTTAGHRALEPRRTAAGLRFCRSAPTSLAPK